MQLVSSSRKLLAGVNQAPQRMEQSVPAPYNTESNALPCTICSFRLKISRQQTHQRGNLIGRPLPVITGKRVQRQICNAECRRGFNNNADRVSASVMACDAGQAASLGPAAVAIHNDGAVKVRLVHKFFSYRGQPGSGPPYDRGTGSARDDRQG